MPRVAYAAGDFEFPRIDIPVGVQTIDLVVRFLIQDLVQSDKIHPDHAELVLDKVLYRESLGSTGIGRGFAFPHAKSDLLQSTVGVVGKCSPPILLPGSQDRQPVHTVCLVVSPPSSDAHLLALQAFAEQMRLT